VKLIITATGDTKTMEAKELTLVGFADSDRTDDGETKAKMVEGTSVSIPGLEYYPDFFSADEQIALLAVIDNSPWKSFIAKRQQFYGEIYFHTSYKSKDAQPDAGEMVGLDMQLMDMLKEKCMRFFEPLDWPTQVLVNEYRNNQGTVLFPLYQPTPPSNRCRRQKQPRYGAHFQT
jgi:hypothetical protein